MLFFSRYGYKKNIVYDNYEKVWIVEVKSCII